MGKLIGNTLYSKEDFEKLKAHIDDRETEMDGFVKEFALALDKRNNLTMKESHELRHPNDKFFSHMEDMTEEHVKEVGQKFQRDCAKSRKSRASTN